LSARALPQTHWVSLQCSNAPINPLFVFRGPTSKGKGGERIGVEGKGRGRRGEERRGKKRRGGSKFVLCIRKKNSDIQ